MANEIRVRANFVGGLVEDAPLSSSATVLTSASLANLPVIDSTHHAALIIDPDAVDGNAEIVWVTAHTAAATTATILRGQEGTTARQHAQDTPWVHTSTVQDYEPTMRHSFRVVKSTEASNQALTSNTDTKITWGAEHFDISNTFDLAADRFDVPEAGIYMFGATIQFENVSDQSWSDMSLYKNGATEAKLASSSVSVSGAGGYHGLSGTTILQCSPGDYIELYARLIAPSGSPLVHNHSGCYFWGGRVA